MINQNYQLLIQKLDQFIRKYYTNQLIRGVLYFIGLNLLLFISFSVLEYFYYFSTGVRKGMFFSMLGVSLVSLGMWIVLPALHYMRLGKIISHEQAATIIGDHFGDVKDKLLNILQLNEQAKSNPNNDLLLAGIDQKSAEIKPVPFTNAIDLTQNKKYLRFALPPLFLLLIILFAAPSMITDSTERILKNNQEFERQAPFTFLIQNESLVVPQNEDFTLLLDLEGKAIPKDVYVEINEFTYRMTPTEEGGFTYTFKNVQRDIPFKFYAAGFRSKSHQLEIIKKPNLSNFTAKLVYPTYTGLKPETLTNVGDFTVPIGTKVEWILDATNTSGVEIAFENKSETIKAERKGATSYLVSERILASGYYQILLRNESLPIPDSFKYAIQVVPDQYPTIDVQQFVDSNSIEKILYFAGSAQDDYGIKSIAFVFDIIDDKGNIRKQDTMLLSGPTGKSKDYKYIWDLGRLQLKPGERTNYFFEVADNDGVNGSKKSRTPIMSYAKPTVDQYKEMASKNNEDIKESLSKSVQEMKKIQEELKELRAKLLQEKDMSWQRKKELERLLERKAELEKAIQESKQKFQENLQNQQEFDQPDQQVQDKQEKLNELFEQVIDPEKQELMQKIQELMQELSKEDALKQMEQMSNDSRNQEMEMDRLLELFKTLEMEHAVKEQAKELEKLANEQDKLRQDMNNPQSNKEEQAKKQEELNKKMDDLLKKMEDIEKKNKELDKPKNLGDNKGLMEDAKDEMKDAKEQIEQNNKKGAQSKQKSASQKMRDAASGMSSSMSSGDMAQMEEDMKALRQIMENVLTLSFDQEHLIDEFNKVNTATPAYVRLVRDQSRIRDNFRIVEDSLVALSKRVFQLESFITEKITTINSEVGKSLAELEERRKPQAGDHQQRVMKNLNDLALMLSETMEQMQNAMAQMTPGTQMCQNPGDSPGEQGNKPMDKITEGQEGITEDMKKMKDKMGKGEQGSSKEFAEIAAKQAQLKKMLEALQKERQQQGKGSPLYQEIIDQMNRNEIDLVNKRLTNEMIKRQQDILTRLLEAEKATREQDWDEKRKAERPEFVDRKLPPSLEEYIKKREAESEMFKSVPASLKPYYKQLAESYYNTLKD
jgi:hypothetical protein